MPKPKKSDSKGLRLSPKTALYGAVAQLVLEYMTFNHGVGSSNLLSPTHYLNFVSLSFDAGATDR